MKQLLFLAIAACMVSVTTMAQSTVNAKDVNVSRQIKLKTKTITNIETGNNFSSDSSLPTAKAVGAYVAANAGGDLQSVTTAGNITTNSITSKTANNSNSTGFSPFGFSSTNNASQSYGSLSADGLDFSQQQTFSSYYLRPNRNPTLGSSLVFPNSGSGEDRVIPVSVNGIVADDDGNIPLPSSGWGFNGNAIADGNFIGTTNNKALILKANNLRYGWLDPENENLSFGKSSLFSAGINTYSNVAYGKNSQYSNASGSGNSSFGENSLYSNISGFNNVSVGYGNLFNYLGSGSIGIGTFINMPNNTLAGQLNIGNSIFGTGLYTGYSLSSAAQVNTKIGIANNSPQYTLDVAGTVNTTSLRINTNSGLNKVLTSDLNGLATWQMPVVAAGPNKIYACYLESTGANNPTNSNILFNNTSNMSMYFERIGLGTYRCVRTTGTFSSKVCVTFTTNNTSTFFSTKNIQTLGPGGSVIQFEQRSLATGNLVDGIDYSMIKIEEY